MSAEPETRRQFEKMARAGQPTPSTAAMRDMAIARLATRLAEAVERVLGYAPTSVHPPPEGRSSP